MPLALSPIIARRASDNAVSQAYGARHASTHTPSATRPGPISDELAVGFARAGYPLQTEQITAPGLIEVYPHPALIARSRALAFALQALKNPELLAGPLRVRTSRTPVRAMGKNHSIAGPPNRRRCQGVATARPAAASGFSEGVQRGLSGCGRVRLGWGLCARRASATFWRQGIGTLNSDFSFGVVVCCGLSKADILDALEKDIGGNTSYDASSDKLNAPRRRPQPRGPSPCIHAPGKRAEIRRRRWPRRSTARGAGQAGARGAAPGLGRVGRTATQ